MWVTQSYLGDPDKDPKVYTYYLFEEYDPKQVIFTERVQDKLAHVGDQVGPHATILLPNENNTPRIEGEIRAALEQYWPTLRDQLPGLLVTTSKLSEFSYRDGGHYFFSLANVDTDGALDVVTEVHRLMQQCIEYQHKNQGSVPPETLFKRFVDCIEAKPGVFGFSFDLRQFFEK